MLFLIIPVGLLAGMAGLSPVAAVAVCAIWQAMATYLVTKRKSQLQAALAMAMVSVVHFLFMPILVQAEAAGTESAWFNQVAPLMPQVIVVVGVLNIIVSTATGIFRQPE